MGIRPIGLPAGVWVSYFSIYLTSYYTCAAHIGFSLEQLFLLQLSVSPDSKSREEQKEEEVDRCREEGGRERSGDRL